MNQVGKSFTQPSVSPKSKEMRGNLGLSSKQTLTSSAANVLLLKKNLQITSSASNFDLLNNQALAGPTMTSGSGTTPASLTMSTSK